MVWHAHCYSIGYADIVAADGNGKIRTRTRLYELRILERLVNMSRAAL